jgi:hypothetical protein
MIKPPLVTGDPYVTRAREVCARNPCRVKTTCNTCNTCNTITNHSTIRKQSSIRGGFVTGGRNISCNTCNKQFLDGKDSPAAPNRCTSPLTRGIWSRWSE